MLRLAIAIPRAGVLCLWLGREVVRALRTGVANAGGKLIHLRERPSAFWLTIGVQSGFMMVSGWMLLSLLLQALSGIR
jgi:hypothetical protein